MKAIKSILRVVVLVLLLAALVSIVTYRGLIADGVRAFMYQPSETAANLAESVDFAWLGKLYFYASQPVIDQTNRASAECGVEKSTAVLGCYANGIIYVYDIDNTELKYVEEVTAAHEMLHAAYTRLSDQDRTSVNLLLSQELENLEGNDTFRNRMSAYDKLSKADRLNELHSIIGTEIVDISDNLEGYYEQYFNNRSRIAEMYHQYSSIFFRIQDEVKRHTRSYNQLVEERNAMVVSANNRYDILQSRIAAARRSGGMSESEVREINDQIDQYNSFVIETRRQLEIYDQQLSELKKKIEVSIAHQQDLNRTLDSSLAPATQL